MAQRIYYALLLEKQGWLYGCLTVPKNYRPRWCGVGVIKSIMYDMENIKFPNDRIQALSFSPTPLASLR